MISSIPRRARLAWLLLLATPLAAAQAPQCGLFKAEEGSSTLRFDSPGRGEQQHYGSAPAPFALQRIDGTLQLVDLQYGLPNALQFRDGGRSLELDGSRYTLHEPARCEAAATPAAGSCLADPAGCLEGRFDAPPARLEAACREGVPGMCLQLADQWRDDAGKRASDATQKSMLEAAIAGITLPPACRDGGFEQGTAACQAAVQADPALQQQLTDAAIAAAATEVMQSLVDSGPRPAVPASRRQQLLQLCQQVPHGGFCARVAELAWDAGDPAQALAALTLACTPGADPSACERVPALQALGASLQPRAATALPCGSYRADGGLMDTLDFGDAGLVGIGWGSQLRARLENGDIRIRHDKGGDFVLRPLPGGQLLGLDRWTRYQVFAPTGEGTSQCAAPRQYTVVPLPQDCPQALAEGGAEACCAQGKLQGCNVLGNRLALSGQWPQAAAHYTTVCRAGVREGCENLVSAQGNSEDVDARSVLEQLCAADHSGRHVACDVLATGNWAMLTLGRELQKAADALENEDAPAARGSNRKD